MNSDEFQTLEVGSLSDLPKIEGFKIWIRLIQGHDNIRSGEKEVLLKAFEKDILVGLFKETVKKQSTFLLGYSHFSIFQFSLFKPKSNG